MVYFSLGRCIECVKASPYLELANELEITKAITYLKEKDLAKVCKTVLKISAVQRCSYCRLNWFWG